MQHSLGNVKQVNNVGVITSRKRQFGTRRRCWVERLVTVMNLIVTGLRGRWPG
jgi:hypothetical protein